MLFALLALRIGGAVAQPADGEKGVAQEGAFERRVTATFRASYLLYLPEGYGKHTTAAWPLMIYLHSADARGADLNRLKSEGLPALLGGGRKLPCIVVAPQCPLDEWWDSRWSMETVMALLDHVCEKYAVDKARVYLTGWSMGGTGVWRLAATYPKRFAAIAPISGRGQLRDAPRLAAMPVWIVHGGADRVVPATEAYRMAEALSNNGGHPKLTVCDQLEHDAWPRAYADTELFDWLLQQRIPQK